MARRTDATEPGTPRASGKARIREAAREAIVDQGFDLAVSRDITAAAGVSRALLFYHYESLEECLIDAVETSVSAETRRFEAAVEGLVDPADRAALLVEWHIPASTRQRREWLLTFEFVRASFRSARIADVAARQYGEWHGAVAGEYTRIAAALSADEVRARANRLIGLSEGLSWQLILGNPSLPEDEIRAILAATVAADLGLPAERLRRTGDHLADRLATIRGC
jgi:AcrR family transcriptional regulator